MVSLSPGSSHLITMQSQSRTFNDAITVRLAGTGRASFQIGRFDWYKGRGREGAIRPEEDHSAGTNAVCQIPIRDSLLY